MRNGRNGRVRARRARASMRFAVLAWLLVAWGCGGDSGEGKPPETPIGDIRLFEPAPGQIVKGHSVHFSAALDPDLDASRLSVMLNSVPVGPSHLRVKGSQVEGTLSGMKPGENIVTLAAPGIHGGVRTVQVSFTFAPVPISSVALADTLRLPGLEGVVEVVVDPWGVHHIYTMENNPMDVWYAEGYIMARHRLFQMDFFRKVAQGRLTELLGTALNRGVLELDLYYRTLFLTYEGGTVGHIDEALAAEIARTRPDLYEALGRFVEGVNDFIADVEHGTNGAVLPQQYRLLNLLLPSYTIEPMTIPQVLAIGRLQQFDLSQTLGEEIRRKVRWERIRDAEARGDIPAGTLEDIFRAEPPDHETILKPGEPGYSGPSLGGRSAAARRGASSGVRSWTKPAESGAADPDRQRALLATADRLSRIRRIVWGSDEKPFSNNWILAPSMTASGNAILCNDPHLSLSNPSIFYPHHCDNKTFSGGTMNFSGVTFPGIPGILLGQNESAAWGATVTNYDVMDIYEETVHTGGEGKCVEFRGECVPVERVLERFKIRGGDPELGQEVDIPIDYVPHHGPQVPGNPFDPDPTLTPQNNLTVRWTGHFLTKDLEAFYGLLDAADVDDFRASIANFGVGAQNFVCAASSGRIAYFPNAHIPIRSQAALTAEHPPYLPLPGTGEYEWVSDAEGRPQYVPLQEVPQVTDPARGWLVTSNNDITGSALDNDVLNDPLYLYYSINVGFRGGRISERLLALNKEERDLEHMMDIQADHVSLLARRIVPHLIEALSNQAVLEGLPAETRARVQEAGSRLASWNFRCASGMPDPFTGQEPPQDEIADSISASIFSVWFNRLTEAALGDELSKAGTDMDSEEKATALLHIVERVDEPEGSPYAVHTLGPDGQSLLWDDVTTADKRETRDEIMVRALVRALEDLTSLMKTDDMSSWQWGKLHTITFELEGIGGAIYAFNLPSYSILEQVLGVERKGYPRPGGWQTVDPADYTLSGLDFTTDGGPAMRMVVELEDGVMRAYNVLPGGVNDLYPTANIFRPVEVNQALHYGDQIPLWLANKYRPQFVFWEDVTQAAESRIRCEPRR